MKKAAHDTRLEYEAPTAEIIRLGTEDILTKSPGETSNLPDTGGWIPFSF